MVNRHDPALPISRRWEQYLVKAVFEESRDSSSGLWVEASRKQIVAYKANKISDYECQIFVLPSPIVVQTGDVKDILVIKDEQRSIRVYPPFPINEKGESSGALADVNIPVGLSKVEVWTEIPNVAVKGVRFQHASPPGTTWCRGIRADVQFGADIQGTLKLLIEHICQYTHQWWLRGNHNPFFGMKRLGADVDRDFRPRELLTYKGAEKVESPWYGAVEFQPVLGVAAPLTRQTWLLISDHVSNKRPADTGILGLHDAFADYMAGRDERCILNLCIAVEILISKHRQVVLKKSSNETLEKIIRTTPLVEDHVKEDLKKLMIDRDHVAHGRAPYILRHNHEYTLERYIQAARKVLEGYISNIPGGLWPAMMAMNLERVRR